VTRIPNALKTGLLNGTKTVHFTKSRTLNSRISSVICDEIGSGHATLLFHTEVWWLSRDSFGLCTGTKLRNSAIQCWSSLPAFITSVWHSVAPEVSTSSRHFYKDKLNLTFQSTTITITQHVNKNWSPSYAKYSFGGHAMKKKLSQAVSRHCMIF
jgi:hypothetical protein